MTDKDSRTSPAGRRAGVAYHPAALARRVAEAGPLAQVLLDKGDRVMWTSEGFRRLLGGDEAPPVGERLTNLLQRVVRLPGDGGGDAAAGGWRRVWLLPRGQERPRMVLMAETSPVGQELGGARLLSFIDLEGGSAGLYPPLADPRTGLTSTWVFEDRLQHAMDRADRHEHGLALLLLRLDRANRILHERGEAAVQALLRQVSRRLAGTLRAEDSLSYLGCHRWGVLLEHPITPEGLQAAALRCLEAMEAPLSLGSPPMLMTLSIGIAFYPGDGETVEGLLAAAEQALQHARPGGHAFLDRDLRRQLASRLAFREALQEALLMPDRHFQVVYQPQVEMSSGRCVAVECLLRWQHPRRGYLRPDDFLPLVAEMGQMVRLDRWVIEQAIYQRQRWLAEGSSLAALRIAVNLDASLLVQTAFDGRPLDRFLLEIVEDLDWLNLEFDGRVIGDFGDAHSLLFRRLDRLGARLVADHLGEEPLDLLRLSRLPIRGGKVSRVLVGDLGAGASPTRQALEALAQALERLGVEATAVGIETQAQFDAAQQAGLRRAQGHFIGEPMRVEALSAWFSGRGVDAT